MDFQIKGRREKKKRNTACRVYMQIFELGHTTVPYGVKAQGHAAGTNQREKNPQIATKEERTTCTGTENKTSQLVSRRGGNSKNRNFEQAEKKIPRRGLPPSVLHSRWFGGANPLQGT